MYSNLFKAHFDVINTDTENFDTLDMLTWQIWWKNGSSLGFIYNILATHSGC